jgi:SAM-dependent methyltransferase
MVVFPESKLAHSLLDGRRGLEIGAAAHNPFGLTAWNATVDPPGSFYDEGQRTLCGRAAKIDVVASGDRLPFADGSLDFVLSSHVLEHFPDPIRALKEWHRVVRNGGIIFAIVPHKFRTFDKYRPRTPLSELVARHAGSMALPNDTHEHCSVWLPVDVAELIAYLGWPVVVSQDTDDKVGNGFTVVISVEKC